MDNSILIQNFIDQIWNTRAFEKLESFLHSDFKDHSLPPMLPTDKEGTKKWIINTGISFEHNTVIEDQVTEKDKSIVKIKMNLKHIGIWRDIEPTGINLHTIGYRYFKLKGGKIIEHWALIDGQAIENQLKDASHACKIAE
ncbi:ester cyclase [Catalinimonas niigatensis]|uniref:ester cyclase n=1 Tax=Catalinimonas niigatensis TaxID=1397264 RepID=UPI00266690EC|nr:ester cyclase [Catalinimonas niigatensis]WPP49949.1 ester cyclase [Catalinimonas niigatensis]